MSQQMLPRFGAACGALFTIGLFAGNRTGVMPLEIVALVLFLPFLAYLCGSVLRQAEGADGWLWLAALCGGLAGITLKLASIPSGIAQDKAIDGSPLDTALQTIGNAATVACLVPFALMLAAVALVALRTDVLPRWLGYLAAATALALVVNGAFLHADFVPALLLLLLWTLLTSIVLLRDTQPRASQQAVIDATT